VIEDSVTMERWRAYEDEWKSSPHIDDLAAHFTGWHKAQQPAEVEMSIAEYRKKYRGAGVVGGKRES
jgi:hypothetical protein